MSICITAQYSSIFILMLLMYTWSQNYVHLGLIICCVELVQHCWLQLHSTQNEDHLRQYGLDTVAVISINLTLQIIIPGLQVICQSNVHQQCYCDCFDVCVWFNRLWSFFCNECVVGDHTLVLLKLFVDTVWPVLFYCYRLAVFFDVGDVVVLWCTSM